MDRCLTLDEFERHAAGELSADDSSRFELHITECQHCKTVYRSFLADDRFLAELKKGLAPSGLEGTKTDPARPFRVTDDPAAARDPTGLDETRPATERLRRRTEETVSYASIQARARSESGASRRERLPRIHGYTIKRIIGRGGMGVVYEAIQEKLHRPVAVKLLPAVASSAQPELITRFQREAAAAAKLHHTNIIPIYDFGESPDGYYYAMELITGQPLNVLIRRFAGMDEPMTSAASIAALLIDSDLRSAGEAPPGSITEDTLSISRSPSMAKGWTYYRQITRWMADVAEALHHAHLQGMVHRDIKPGNLMLCTDGRMVVLDFGLVKSTGDQTVTASGSIVGTYRYMSPEQVRGKHHSIDPRSDVYSLGATLYELLTFQPPFLAMEQSQLLSQILSREPVPPRKVIPSVPIDLQTICLKALEKSPGARYQTARAMADDLGFYLRGMAIVARRQGPIRRAIKLVRRRRVETAALVTVLLLAGATGYGFHLSGKIRRTERLDLMKSGIDHWHAHEWAAAAAAFTEVLDRNADDYGALVSWASAYKDQYYATGDKSLLHRASELLDRAAKLQPERSEAWNVRGVVLQGLGQPSEANDAYAKVIELDEGSFAVWVNLGTLYATIGDLAKAETYLQKGVALARETSNPMPWRVLGALQLERRQDEAFETLTKACTISENQDVASLVLYAQYHLAHAGDENTWEAFESAVAANKLSETLEHEVLGRGERNETVARVKRTLALVALRQHRWKAAAQAAQQALAIGDQPAFGHLILAVATGHLGDLAAAREHLRRSETAWPEPLKHSAVRFIKVGQNLWFDTAEELQQLADEARRIIGMGYEL